jgi:hypothetical protein
MQEGRDHWWHCEMEKYKGVIIEPEPVDAEHPLYILYTVPTAIRAFMRWESGDGCQRQDHAPPAEGCGRRASCR